MNNSVLKIVLLTLCAVFASGQNSAPITAEDFFNEGLQYVRQNRFEEALAAFERSAALDDKQPATFANIGNASLTLQKYAKAENAYRAAIRLQADEPKFHSNLCMALSLQKKHDEAVRSCEEGVRLAPDSDTAFSMLVTAMEMAGRNDLRLRQAIEIALDRFRSSEIILVQATDFYIRTKQYGLAVGLLESLTSIWPNTAKYHGVLAQVFLLLGEDARSLGSARTALRLDAADPYGNYAMGRIFFELGQHDEAVESFAKVVSDDPRLADSAYFQAVSESRRGRPAAAVILMQTLTDRQPDNVGYLLQLADDLAVLRRRDEAERVYLRILDISPNNFEALIGLGMSYMMRAKFEEAITHFSKATELKPDNEHVAMFLRVARGRQVLTAKIPEMIRDADADPASVKKRLELIRVLAAADRIKEAQRYIGELYALNPDDPAIYQLLGVSLSEAGLTDMAFDAFRTSNDKEENPAAYLGLTTVYSERGDIVSTLSAYAKVIEMKPDSPNIMKAYADLLRTSGKRREALEMYKRSLSLLPNNAPALFQAGMLSMKFGEKDNAVLYLESLKPLDTELARVLEKCLALRIW